MARNRYQRGCLFLRGKREKVWVARWREDQINADGTQHQRVHRTIKIGTLAEFPTKKLALRELNSKIEEINAQPLTVRVNFAQFANRWIETVLPQHKPSSQSSERAHIKKYLVPAFDQTAVADLSPEIVQQFVAGAGLHPKTLRNVMATLRVMWKTARAWGYARQDIFDGVVLPRSVPPQRFCFTLDQVKQILAEAEEPFKTMYWLAAETGMRGGELCGLKVADFDLDHQVVRLQRSAWRGKLQTPKTQNAIRSLSISPQLIAHLREYLKTKWQENLEGLLFCTQTGHAYDNYNVVTWQLHPLLDKLKIARPKRCGLHAFRHLNATLLVSNGTSMKVTQRRLGHADPTTTLGVYAHVLDPDEKKAAEQIGAQLFPNLFPTSSQKTEVVENVAA